MATHFSILTWRIPWTEEPGGLQLIGLQNSQIWLKQLNDKQWITQKKKNQWKTMPMGNYITLPNKTPLRKASFIFYIATNNVVIVSSTQRNSSAWHKPVYFLHQTPLPSWRPCNVEQSSLWNRRTLLVFHFKYGSMYMSIPNSLTVLSPHPSPWWRPNFYH